MDADLRADGWTWVDDAAVRGRAFIDGRLLEPGELAERFAETAGSVEPLDAIASVATNAEGFFSAVVEADDATYLVADAARSIPLYYASDGSVVSDRGRVVQEAAGSGRRSIAEREFLLTRYVTGPETIWQDVSAMQPGEIVRIDGNERSRRRYWEYRPTGGADSPRKRLREGIETTLDRLQLVADGRPVAVPLSGGYDSRLLAAGLAARDHEVICYTFGRSGHPDVEVSREVADRLGVRWEFVEYSETQWREWYHSNACQRYRNRAFGGDGLPFLAGWPAVRTLLAEGRIPETALFCPGHTVATPSERLPRFAGETGDGRADVGCGGRGELPEIAPSVETLVEYVLDEHYTLWESDETFEAAVGGRIRRDLLGGRPAEAVGDPETAAAAYERWEWNGRMSTFTNGELRIYEDCGVDWWLPLWDPAYVRAWSAVPLALRRDKRLHTDLAVEYYRDGGDVTADRAGVTDRTLSPSDRQLSLLRHTPVRQFTERNGDWEPPFLRPRSEWSTPGNHPLAWYGAVDESVLQQIADSRRFYALRTLAIVDELDMRDGTGWPTDDGDLPSSR